MQTAQRHTMTKKICRFRIQYAHSYMNWIILNPTINFCQQTAERTFSAWFHSMVQRRRTELAIKFKIKRIREVYLGSEFLHSHALVKISALGSCSFMCLSPSISVFQNTKYLRLRLYRAFSLASMIKPTVLLKTEYLSSWISTSQPTSLTCI